MKIVVDAFGGDNAPLEIIKGAALAAAEYGVDILLSGDKNEIEKCISQNNIVFPNGYETEQASDVISMHDDPTSILKAHKDSSMAVAFRALSEGRADAFVSAGSTGAIVVGGTLIVKRIKGVRRPALGSMIPSPNGKRYMLMDMGANSECRPEMLCQFGIMASVYAESVAGVENPTIGLLNIGTEDTKGDELRREAYALLKNAPINFVGNIESREMPKGKCDVVITDGFTGNIALKLMEGTTLETLRLVKGVLLSSLLNKLAAAILKKDFGRMKAALNSSEIGGAPLLGVRKPVIKAHGNSDALAIKNAVYQAVAAVENNVCGVIEQKLAEMGEKE